MNRLIADEAQDIIRSQTAYPFTPDYFRLSKYHLQLLFVMDEWSSDRHQSFVIKDSPGAELLGRGFTEERFDFLVKETDPMKTAFALLNPDGCRIQGEIWAIRPETFISLDKLKQNGLRFLRHRIPILYPYRLHGFVQNYNGLCTPDGIELPKALQGKKHWIGPEMIWRFKEMWMYVGHPNYWTDMVHQSPFFFERVKRFEPKKEKTWLDRYYRYQNPQ